MASILIAEDTDLIRKALESAMARQGHTVAVATNGREAIDLLARFQYDVVITDLVMPYVDGIELIKHIKGTPELSDIGVIVLSSVGQEKKVTQAFEAGADEFFAKPVKYFELSLCVDRLAANRGILKRAV